MSIYTNGDMYIHMNIFNRQLNYKASVTASYHSRLFKLALCCTTVGLWINSWLNSQFSPSERKALLKGKLKRLKLWKYWTWKVLTCKIPNTTIFYLWRLQEAECVERDIITAGLVAISTASRSITDWLLLYCWARVSHQKHFNYEIISNVIHFGSAQSLPCLSGCDVVGMTSVFGCSELRS